MCGYLRCEREREDPARRPCPPQARRRTRSRAQRGPLPLWSHIVSDTTSRARHTQVRTTVDTTRIRRTLDTLSGTVTLHHFSSPSFPLFFFPSVAAACSQTIGDKALHGHSSPPAKRPHATSAYPFSVCARTSLLPANANHLLTLFTSLGSHLFLLVCTATLLWATLL